VRWLRIVVGLLGIAITLCAWLISHHDRFPFVDRVLAPEYAMAMTALNRMHQKGNIVLKSGEVGFAEISEILKDGMQSGAPIVQIKKVNAGQAVIETSSGIESQHFFDLRYLSKMDRRSRSVSTVCINPGTPYLFLESTKEGRAERL